MIQTRTDQVCSCADVNTDCTDDILISGAHIPEPASVRYAWATNPQGANLINSEDLPASIFRTYG
jgi:sialate O-acetylesterase